MNGLRRISQHLVKATAVGGLLLASALPFALANTAGAATFSPNTPPAAPTGLIAASGLDSASIGTGGVTNATIGLTWTASVYGSANGASAATGYNVYEGTTAGGESTTPLNGAVPLTGTSMTVPGLTDGTAYFFTVQAVNAYGSSTASTEATDTPAGASSAPTAVTIAGGNGQSTISWAAPAKTNGSAVVGYNVYVTTTAPVAGTDAFVTALNTSTGGSWLNVNGGVNGSNAPACTPFSIAAASAANSLVYVPFNGAECTALGAYSPSNLITGTSETITGLTNGTAYYFVVTAVNGVGESQGALASSSATTPGTVATALTGVSVIGGISIGQPGTTVEVTWPSVPGETFNIYQGTTPGGEAATPINLAPLADNPQAALGNRNGYPVTGLTTGTSYYFYVKAINAGGSSTPSNEVVYVAGAGLPGAPTGVTAVGANTSATVTWTAPANTGGSVIDHYVVQASSNNGATWGTAGTTAATSGATHLTVTGLTNGLTYVFDVAAVNSKNLESAFSTTSNSVVPATTVPSAVKALGVSISGGVATLTWPVANATGGANSEGGTIAGYGILVGTTSGSEALVAEIANGGATSATYTVGTSGTFYFQIVAQSNLGIGAVSNEAVATSGAGTPLTPPTALTTSLYSSDTYNPATGASEQIISFTPSTNDGGGSILAPAAGYAVYQVTGTDITGALSHPALSVLTACVAGTPCVDSTNSDATDYYIGGLTGGTSYSFILVPVNAIGVSDGLSTHNLAPSSIVTFKAAAASGAPSGVSAVQTGTSVTVSWNAPLNADGTTAIGYGVYTNTSGTFGGTALKACPQSGACLANVVSGTTAVVSGLSAGTNNFWVTSTNDGLTYGSPGGPVSVIVTAPPTFITGTSNAPQANFGMTTGMNVTHGSLTGSPTILHWSATASPGGLSCTGTSDASCTIVGLTNGVTYTIMVSVTTATGTVSEAANMVSQPLGVPAAPSVTASAVGTAAAVYSVSLSWNQPTDGGSGITLYTATSTNSATLVTANYTVASALWAYNQATGLHAASETAALTYFKANVTSYCIVPQGYVSGGVDSVDTSNQAVPASTTCTIYDIGASTSPTFTYTVAAYNTNGHATSAASNSLKLLATGTVPKAPTNFAAAPGATTSTVNLSWTAPSATGGSDIVGYNIFEGTASGAETTTPVNGVSPIVGTTVAIPNLTLGKKYFFTVVAVNANGSSAPGYNVLFTAQEISYTAIGSPGVATGLSASSTAGTSASLSWSAPASTGGAPIIGYLVYAGTSAGGESATPVNSALVTGTSYTVTGLNSGTTYYFVVVADNGLAFSAPSSEANAKTSGTSSGVPILPTVTGTYYVPTFSTNAAVVINGTGFTTGMTVTSSNPAYTVTLAGIGGIDASGAGTTATLSVTTTSAATAGTSTAIVFKNADGGAVSFALNGGPAPTPPPPVVKVLMVSGVHGTILTGRTVTIIITGTGFYGQPRIISNAAGTTARVTGDTGTRLTVRVTVRGNRRGVHTFTIILANGKSVRVNYTQH